MNVRPDVDFYNEFIEKGLIGVKQAATLIHLPLVVVPDIELEQFSKLKEYVYDCFEDYTLPGFDINSYFTGGKAYGYDDFVFSTDPNNYFRYHQLDDSRIRASGLLRGPGDVLQEFDLGITISSDNQPTCKFIKVNGNSIRGMKLMSENGFRNHVFGWHVMLNADEIEAKVQRSFLVRLTEIFLSSLKTLHAFIRFCHENDLYRTVVTPAPLSDEEEAKIPITPREILVSRKGARIIYLNKLPESKEEAEKANSFESGIKQVVLRRIGYWKTLVHPRYQHHKKYRVYKGVYVKPVWKGDETTIIEGNVYTIVDENPQFDKD